MNTKVGMGMTLVIEARGKANFKFVLYREAHAGPGVTKEMRSSSRLQVN